MSIGSWDPNAATTAPELSPELLGQLADLSRKGQLQALSQHLQPEWAAIMKIDHAHWQLAVSELDTPTIEHLIRVLTLAEKLPGWEAGDQSPVIALARQLRGQGQRLDRELLLWIRQVSDNRFLPYGPL